MEILEHFHRFANIGHQRQDHLFKMILIFSILWTFLTVACINGNDRIKFYSQDSLAYQDNNVAWQKQQGDLVRKELLDMLGLRHAPTPQRNVRHKAAPQFMLELYKQFEYDRTGEGDSFAHNAHITNITSLALDHEIDNADMIVSFTNKEKSKDTYVNAKVLKLTFDQHELPEVEQVRIAELRILRDATGSNESMILNIQNNEMRKRRNFHPIQKVLAPADVGWIEIDVTEVVRTWRRYPNKELTLEVFVQDQSGQELRLNDAGLNTADNNCETFIVAAFETPYAYANLKQKRDVSWRYDEEDEEEGVNSTEVHMRYRRNAKTRSKGKMQKSRNRQGKGAKASCHRESFFVKFTDLDWQDWVIAPDGYAAYYCEGRCTFPLNTRMNATNHAIVQTLVALMNSRYPPPCCAPTTLNQISVLYMDEFSNVILRKFKNMVVTACGCH